MFALLAACAHLLSTNKPTCSCNRKKHLKHLKQEINMHGEIQSSTRYQIIYVSVFPWQINRSHYIWCVFFNWPKFTAQRCVEVNGAGLWNGFKAFRTKRALMESEDALSSIVQKELAIVFDLYRVSPSLEFLGSGKTQLLFLCPKTKH